MNVNEALPGRHLQVVRTPRASWRPTLARKTHTAEWTKQKQNPREKLRVFYRPQQ